MPDQPLYERDFYAWTQAQAAALRRLAQERTNLPLDLDHLAEEIESLGRSEKRELVSRLAVLLLHLLKWQVQPAMRGNSWRLTIEVQRRQLDRHLRDNPSLGPSLRADLDGPLADAYGDALIQAERETGLARSSFPATCPWSSAQAMDAGFWPD